MLRCWNLHPASGCKRIREENAAAVLLALKLFDHQQDLEERLSPRPPEAAARSNVVTYRCSQSAANAGAGRHAVDAAVVDAHAAGRCATAGQLSAGLPRPEDGVSER